MRSSNVPEKWETVITVHNDINSDEEDQNVLNESGTNLIEDDISLMDSIGDLSQSIDTS